MSRMSQGRKRRGVHAAGEPHVPRGGREEHIIPTIEGLLINNRCFEKKASPDTCNHLAKPLATPQAVHDLNVVPRVENG